jgi:flagellar protein FlbT
MSALVLELKQGETMIINGAVIRFKTRARLELTTQSRFMFGKQIMEPHEAVTPAKRLYHDIQTLYVGPPENRAAARTSAFARIANFTNPVPFDDILTRIGALIESENLFEALKLARQLIRHEDQSLAVSAQ